MYRSVTSRICTIAEDENMKEKLSKELKKINKTKTP